MSGELAGSDTVSSVLGARLGEVTGAAVQPVTAKRAHMPHNGSQRITGKNEKWVSEGESGIEDGRVA